MADLLKDSIATVPATILPAGEADIAALNSTPSRRQGTILNNGMILPPLDSDYLQYTPNNKLLNFMNLALSVQSIDDKSFERAKRRARELYTESVMSQQLANKDNSLMVVKTIIDEYTNEVSEQEFEYVQIGLRELTSEQLLRLVDEHARMVKVSLNDRLQIITTIFCIITTAITICTLVTSGPGASIPQAAKETGKTALKRFINYITTRLSTLYASTLGRLLLVGEVIGDMTITSREIVNVWNEAFDPNVRSDRNAWLSISKALVSKNPDKFVYQYVMKPSEMIGLLAIWERGDRAVLDQRLRNLIYGKPCYFPTNMRDFQWIKFRISRIGRNVERQIGTPSLFPAFSLVLRIFSRIANKKGVPIVGSILSGGMWLFRVKQFDEQLK
jgi:hypothetical protein